MDRGMMKDVSGRIQSRLNNEIESYPTELVYIIRVVIIFGSMNSRWLTFHAAHVEQDEPDT